MSISQVVSWSRPIPRSSIERSGRALGVSATDVALFAATDAIRAVFDSAQVDTPDYVLTTARAAPEEFLFTFAEGDGKEYKKSQTGGTYEHPSIIAEDGENTTQTTNQSVCFLPF